MVAACRSDSDSIVSVWNAKSFTHVKTQLLPDAQVEILRISRDGELIALKNYFGTVHLFPSRAGSPGTIDFEDSSMLSPAFSIIGLKVLSHTSPTFAVHKLDPDGSGEDPKKCVVDHPWPNKNYFNWKKVYLSPDGETILAEFRKSSSWFEFSPDVECLYVWNARTRKHTYKIPSIETESRQKIVEFSPDGKLLATQARGQLGKIQIRELSTGKLRATLDSPGYDVKTLAMSACGEYVAIVKVKANYWVTSTENIEIWTLASCSKVQTVEVPGEAKVETLAFSWNGNYLAAALESRDGKHCVAVWERLD